MTKKDIKDNGYMDGLCPSCRDWEAPIVTEELNKVRDKDFYVGAGPRKTDRKAQYFRQTWNEYFVCPKCKQRFSIEFSNV